MNLITEEIEGSQLGGTQAAASGVSPYHPTDLSDKIFDINVLVCNYTKNPTKRKETRSDMVLSLINMLTKANRELTFYIEDLKQNKCIEPFCLSSKQDIDEDDDQHLLFWTFIEKLCEEMRDEASYQVLKRLVAQFNALLAEAENAKVNCSPIVFKEFFFRKMKEHLDEDEEKRLNKKLYKNQPITEDKLRKLQVKAVIKALDLGIFDFAETPTIQEVEEVSHELKTKYLPFNFVMTDEFKTRYSKFRQFTEKRGPFFMFNYEIYGQYVVENSKKISVKQIHAISELDLKLRLIRQAMVKTDDHYFAIVKEMMDLFKMKWFKEVRTDQKYDEDWFESFLNRFLASDAGKAFVKLWKHERKRQKLKAVLIGCLRAAGVIEDSYANLGRTIMKADWRTNKNFSTYMSEWADYPFSTWVLDELKG